VLPGVLLHVVVTAWPIHPTGQFGRAFDDTVQHVDDLTIVFEHIQDIDTIYCPGVVRLAARRRVECCLAQCEQVPTIIFPLSLSTSGELG
jgi:hypothetical protein